jgi:hypothetical protein
MTVPAGEAMIPMWWSALATLLAFTSFAATACAQSSGVPTGSVPVSMHRLLSEQDSGIQQPRRAVIRSAVQWQSIEDELRRGRASAVPFPALDFGRSMVILAAMGAQSTGGHTISIEGVYRGGGRLWVVVREESPGPGCMTSQVLTTPAAAVSVPLSDEPVSFVEHKETRDCR